MTRWLYRVLLAVALVRGFLGGLKPPPPLTLARASEILSRVYTREVLEKPLWAPGESPWEGFLERAA